jgi:site-specific recombinase XerD
MNQIHLLEEQNQFLEKIEQAGKSFNTIKNYRTDLNCFNKFLAAHGKDVIINQMTLTQVKEYCQHLDAVYNSPNSVRRRIQALRIFFDFLVEKGRLDTNPIKQAIVAAKVVERPTPPPFIHLKKLYSHIKEQESAENSLERLISLRNQLLFIFIYGSGLKVSDIALLTTNHILKNNKNEYRVLITHPKRDPYSIRLPKCFNALYERYLTELKRQKQNDNLEFLQILFNANPYRILAGGLSPRGIEILFKEMSRKLKIKVTAKTLRQACIFKWLIERHPQSSIKEWMGVQPQYSLRPYVEELEKYSETYTYIEIGDE